MTPREMLGSIDVLAEHLGKTVQRLDAQADEIARQKLDVAMLVQHAGYLRDQVTAAIIEGERHAALERRNFDTRAFAGRVPRTRVLKVRPAC